MLELRESPLETENEVGGCARGGRWVAPLAAPGRCSYRTMIHGVIISKNEAYHETARRSHATLARLITPLFSPYLGSTTTRKRQARRRQGRGSASGRGGDDTLMPELAAMEHTNIAGYLVDQALAQPGATAIVCPGRGALTYLELDARSDRIAAGLEGLGIGRGVRTALMVQPGLELFSIAFALFKLGAVPVLVDPGIGLGHLKGCLAQARPEGFIGVGRAQLARIALGWGRDTIRRTVTVGRTFGRAGTSLAEVERLGTGTGPRLADVAADEIAAIVFTSGSTGPPKGVVYTHGNFLALIEAIRGAYGMQPGEVDLPTFPLFALYDPALGMTTVVPQMDPTRPARVTPENIVGPIQQYGVTTMFGSPALLDRVGRWGAGRGVMLPTLKRVISAGAPVALRIIERFQQMLPADAEIRT